ncbi:hypothetical protein [Shewanella spartinae]|uniref:hypothetical protein n=1 Tax=Shewanella spartinae TaxID=2864205 RepID=UPI001C65C1D2|nr:hypothetical protein [Shewanella spartinae]QYJ93656.1 hypothetical protein K0I31_19120 [Shewanella spartinae]
MKFKYLLPLTMTTVFLSGCANATNTQASINEADLYGNWNCKISSEENSVKISMDYDVSYIRNGKSNGIGILKFKVPDLPEMEYSFAGSSDWELKGGYLIETSTEIKLVNISHPEFDKEFNLESLFPQNISESSKILVLNRKLLKLKSETDGTEYSCTRNPIKN